MNLRESVAGGVRARLAWHRMSARRAAMELGWSEPYMSRRLVGAVPFDVTDLEQLAALLGLPVTAFFEEPFGSSNDDAPEGVQSGRVVRKSALSFLVRAAA